MKISKFFLVLLSAFLLAGCDSPMTVYGTDGKPLSKEESEKVVKRTVASMVENRDFRILVDKMDPMAGPSIHLRDNDWALEVRRDSVGSVLPYFGRGYNVPYGSAMGFHFITRIDSYSVEKPKHDMWRISLTCHTNRDAFKYSIDVYDTGEAYMSVISRYRSVISYSGHVDLDGLSLKRIK